MVTPKKSALPSIPLMSVQEVYELIQKHGLQSDFTFLQKRQQYDWFAKPEAMATALASSQYREQVATELARAIKECLDDGRLVGEIWPLERMDSLEGRQGLASEVIKSIDGSLHPTHRIVLSGKDAGTTIPSVDFRAVGLMQLREIRELLNAALNKVEFESKEKRWNLPFDDGRARVEEADSASNPVTSIEKKSHSDKRKSLEDLIQQPLRQAFDLVGFPEAKRPELLAKLIDTLLAPGLDQQPPTWTEKVQSNRQAEAPAPQQPAALPPLPETAPATWKADKQPGDTPPDFIKRHYGPWLRLDGLGISKADIRRLDASLYMGLLNWLRPKENGQANVLPSDCPLPTLKEHYDRAVQSPIESFEPEKWVKLASAKQRRTIKGPG